LTDSTSAVTLAQGYDPYGAVTSSSGTSSSYGFTFKDTVHFGVFLGIGVQIIISKFCYYDTASGK
jgi:hypothetical protein